MLMVRVVAVLVLGIAVTINPSLIRCCSGSGVAAVRRRCSSMMMMRATVVMLMVRSA